MRNKLRRMALVLLVLAAAVFPAALVVQAQPAADPAAAPTGRNVLVIYQRDDDDRENAGRPDSQALAEYYALRRNVPKENLLGLTLKKDGKPVGSWDYKAVFEHILRPTADKLAEVVEGKPLSDRILFIVTLPGVPVSFNFGVNDKDSKDWWRKTANRSVDQFLMSLKDNVKAGVDEKANTAGAGRFGPLGAAQADCTLPIYGAFAMLGKPTTWGRWKADHPEAAGVYLVTRLGIDAASGRDMLDGSLYAERFLRLPGPDEKTNYRPAIWLDHKPGWYAHDQDRSMNAAIALVQNAAGPGLGNPFSRGRGLEQVWPLVIDNCSEEIGSVAKDQPNPHLPTVVATIKKDADAVDATSVALDGPAPGKGELPSGLCFPRGATVTNGTATATVVGCDAAHNRLRLSSTKGFESGQTIRWNWPGLKFPATDCFIFYGFYGLNRYEDVFQFLPGAVGVHVDSACMTWARGAMQRGIAGTFGVTTEPLSIGIPHGHLMLAALANGNTWAEAISNSLVLSQRWAGVTLGDPLYRPFASLQKQATTRPALEAVAAKASGSEAVISARLGGASEDELADVALFKVEYGLTKTYGQSVEFFDWPNPASNNASGRRFGYSRRLSTRIMNLQRGKTYHFRVIARNPAGLETVSPDGTFSP